MRSLLRFLPAALLFFASFPAGAEQLLTIALAANVNTLDPHMSGTVRSDLSVASHLYSPLLKRDSHLKLHPCVATSWSARNATTWEFHLRPGIFFPNGEPLDAATVAWNLARAQSTASRIRPWFSLIAQVQVISPTVLRIHTRQSFPTLPEQLSMLFLLAPRWTGHHDPATSAMGTGPYELAEFASGDHVTLRAKKHFWGAPPTFDRVVFRIIPEPGSRVAALMAGEIDFAQNFPVEDIGRIRASHRANAAAVSSARSILIKFNTLRPPFQNNPALRLALNYAIDKQAINRTILSGSGRVLDCQMLTPDYFGFNPDLHPIPFDPRRAQELLRQSGVRKGTVIDMDVPIGTYFASNEIAQAVAGQIEEVLGIGIRIHELEFSVYMRKYIKAHAMAPMMYIAQAWPTLDADGLLTLFAPDSPYSYWDDKFFGKDLQQGRSTLDPRARQAAYRQATARMCSEAPGLFLLAEPLVYGVSNRVRWNVRKDEWVDAEDFSHSN